MKAVMTVFMVFLLVACSQTPAVGDGPAVGSGPDTEASVPDYVSTAGDDVDAIPSPDVSPPEEGY